MSNRPNANVTRENMSQGNVLLTCNMAETNSKDKWFLDSGCSNHMTGNIALFSALDQNVKSEVTLIAKFLLWEKEKSKYLQRKVKIKP